MWAKNNCKQGAVPIQIIIVVQAAVQQAFTNVMKRTKAENYQTRKWRKNKPSNQASLLMQKRIAVLCQWRDNKARQLDEGRWSWCKAR